MARESAPDPSPRPLPQERGITAWDSGSRARRFRPRTIRLEAESGEAAEEGADEDFERSVADQLAKSALVKLLRFH